MHVEHWVCVWDGFNCHDGKVPAVCAVDLEDAEPCWLVTEVRHAVFIISRRFLLFESDVVAGSVHRIASAISLGFGSRDCGGGFGGKGFVQSHIGRVCRNFPDLKRNPRDGDGGGVHCLSAGSEHAGTDPNAYGCWGHDAAAARVHSL